MPPAQTLSPDRKFFETGPMTRLIALLEERLLARQRGRLISIGLHSADSIDQKQRPRAFSGQHLDALLQQRERGALARSCCLQELTVTRRV